MPEKMNERNSPVEMKPEDFRKAGYKVVDKIADFLDSLSDKPVSPGKTVAEIKQILGNNKLPLNGIPLKKYLKKQQISYLIIQHLMVIQNFGGT